MLYFQLLAIKEDLRPNNVSIKKSRRCFINHKTNDVHIQFIFQSTQVTEDALIHASYQKHSSLNSCKNQPSFKMFMDRLPLSTVISTYKNIFWQQWLFCQSGRGKFVCNEQQFITYCRSNNVCSCSPRESTVNVLHITLISMPFFIIFPL